MSTWLGSSSNCIGKIFTLQPQWFNPIDMRNGDLTKAIRHNRIRINMGSFVVNLEHLGWIGVLIDPHSCITYHCHATNFARMEPADVYVSRHFIGKFQVEMGHIMNMWLKMRVRLHLDAFRLFAKQIQEDRYIVGSKIPDHINIAAE